METKRDLLTKASHVPTISSTQSSDRPVVGTRDHDVIKHWAMEHQAEPATGERTDSGPATVHVNDGGAGLRFNFPGVSAFRPITWEEWFDHFDHHRLTFVFEQGGQSASRYRLAYDAEWGGQIQ